MRMNQFHRIFGFKRNLAGQHFIKGDTQRIDVRSIIHAPVHPARLLRRHVGQGSFDHVRIVQFVIGMSQNSGNTEVRNFDLIPFRIN